MQVRIGSRAHALELDALPPRCSMVLPRSPRLMDEGGADMLAHRAQPCHSFFDRRGGREPRQGRAPAQRIDDEQVRGRRSRELVGLRRGRITRSDPDVVCLRPYPSGRERLATWLPTPQESVDQRRLAGTEVTGPCGSASTPGFSSPYSHASEWRDFDLDLPLEGCRAVGVDEAITRTGTSERSPSAPGVADRSIREAYRMKRRTIALVPNLHEPFFFTPARISSRPSVTVRMESPATRATTASPRYPIASASAPAHK